uniref:Uncharacterized protein n=1 Tax=Heterorhabditis bacteriophora TaxID=37862 RepID=A0A1I7XRJ9_HETBA
MDMKIYLEVEWRSNKTIRTNIIGDSLSATKCKKENMQTNLFAVYQSDDIQVEPKKKANG